ncbi:hypothetical protein D9M71_331020 [compost metagenome]
MWQPLSTTLVFELSKIGLGVLDFIQQFMTRLLPDTGSRPGSECVAGFWLLIRIGFSSAPFNRKQFNICDPLGQQSITFKRTVGKHNEYAYNQSQPAH